MRPPALWYLVWVLTAGYGGIGFAQDQTPAEAEAIQRVIEAQLNAFAADDAEQAFSLATPGIRDLFSSAETFLTMVRNGYPMVYRHLSIRFLTPRMGNHFSLQMVRMTDTGADVWMVVYRLRKQDDGRWLIDGVTAFPGAPVPDLAPATRGS